ncbi:DUF4383 domain-containing protein [Pseudarthrobacter albicanus]|uniref:DUF4383 domain-containing protein n=1 Tax=Pseudarthrobacter albicanus TaxID=2823873 RepID=UPI001FEA76E8|nr:DUF4383 domain-containing protein [Pseudarthrobacter albicanus]
MARTGAAARNCLIGGGAIYLILWIYWLLTGSGASAANFLPLNSTDNWLHLLLLGLGLGMITTGVVLTRGRDADRNV